ncbi:hypothetical protein FB451DRAFT_1242338 [Mycena latifolia]|nr:hypothetical protein FB451DRAFT_1242338 [Mycena latifolia]
MHGARAELLVLRVLSAQSSAQHASACSGGTRDDLSRACGGRAARVQNSSRRGLALLPPRRLRAPHTHTSYCDLCAWAHLGACRSRPHSAPRAPADPVVERGNRPRPRYGDARDRMPRP